MQKIIVAAKSDNNVIGKDGDLPWHLPADLAHFKNLIQDGYLISGRKSYESPQGEEIFELGRKSVIITRQQNYQVRRGAKVAHSIDESYQIAEVDGAEEVFVLGGAGIYEQTINAVDKLMITEIHASFEGDTFFPEIDPEIWLEASRKDYPADAENPYPFSFVEYVKR